MDNKNLKYLGLRCLALRATRIETKIIRHTAALPRAITIIIPVLMLSFWFFSAVHPMSIQKCKTKGQFVNRVIYLNSILKSPFEITYKHSLNTF